MYVVYKFHLQGNELPGLILKLITKLVFLNGPDTLPILPNSTELPPISTFITYNKCCHWFISTTSLHLCISAVLLFTFATSEQVSLGPTSLGHLMLPDGFFGQVFLISLSSSLAISSAVILANRSGGIFPHSTFFLKFGFFASLRFDILLRTLFLYFMSVFLIS